MLPGFTSPRGSRKDKFELLTACCLSASARDALAGRLCTACGRLTPLVCAVGATFASLVRTKSAHDFGALGFGGDLGVSADGTSATASPAVVVSACTGAASAEVGDACWAVCSTDGGVAFFCKPPMLGTATAVLVSFRACCWAGAVDGFDEDAMACAGVVGVETWVKSASDGACDVAGVSRADVAATVEVSDAGSSAFVIVSCCGDDSDCCTSFEAFDKWGRATASVLLVKF